MDGPSASTGKYFLLTVVPLVYHFKLAGSPILWTRSLGFRALRHCHPFSRSVRIISKVLRSASGRDASKRNIGRSAVIL
eukprot:7924866-Lingulodinium_polyedra.AAC.1